MKINEGLKRGDLKNLVLPLISIDEFESKIDQNACVFAFYINDIGAASDLDRFIQRTHVPILDTEISSAPDQHGYYMVFVELLVNDKLMSEIKEIISEVSDIADIQSWYIHGRKMTKSVKLTDENLGKILPKSNKSIEEQSIQYLKSSLLETISYENGSIQLQSMSGNFDFRLIECKKAQDLANDKFSAIPHNLTFKSFSKCNKLQMALGEGWDVQSQGEYLLVKRFDSDLCLVLK